MVRELGVLDRSLGGLDISCAQAHILIEIETWGAMTVGDLAARLNLDASTVCRTGAKLLTLGLIRSTQGDDRRHRIVGLTPKGREVLARVHGSANSQVGEALDLMTESDRSCVVRGLELYSHALSRARIQRSYSVRPIEPRDDLPISRIIRSVLEDLRMQAFDTAFRDPEIDAMCSSFSEPGSAYFVVVKDDKVVGGAGFGPLPGGEGSTAEIRKVYLLPETRGLGLGRRLISHLLLAAKDRGYKSIYLETMLRMSAARALYESLGFKPLASPMGCTGHSHCEAWYALNL